MKLSPDKAAKLLRLMERDEPKLIEHIDVKNEAIKADLRKIKKLLDKRL